jgi:hypothetical protein
MVAQNYEERQFYCRPLASFRLKMILPSFPSELFDVG